jgi:hypothetical protein
MPVYQFAIAAGWDQPIGSLVNVELIKPTGGPYFHPPDVYPGYDDGNENVRGDQMVSFNGFPSVPWRFMSFWKIQRYYLYHAINGDSNSGKVTIYTLTNQNTTYSRQNAIMHLPELSQSQKNFDNIGPYTVTMRGLHAAS